MIWDFDGKPFSREEFMSESKKLWGGRFEGKFDPGFAEFNNSYRFDRRLFEADVTASIAYCQALENAGVITANEGTQIRNALNRILENGAAENHSAEDVHSFVEARLIELIGDVGRKLHTGRSRNDQVATDVRLWVRHAIDQLITEIRSAQRALIQFAEDNSTIFIPGYTHLQRAQPVLLA